MVSKVAKESGYIVRGIIETREAADPLGKQQVHQAKTGSEEGVKFQPSSGCNDQSVGMIRQERASRAEHARVGQGPSAPLIERARRDERWRAGALQQVDMRPKHVGRHSRGWRGQWRRWGVIAMVVVGQRVSRT